MRWIAAAAFMAAGLALGGCQTTDDALVSLGLQESAQEKAAKAAWAAHVAEIDPTAAPAPYRAPLEAIKTGPQTDAPLHYMKLGVIAMEHGDLRRAGAAFDQVNAVVESIIADSEQAEDARSLWNAESDKLFKGEPYERAMSFYYRGVLDLMAGDYQNARAAFKAAQLQDFLAEEQDRRGDFWLFATLEGWASQCNGDLTLAEDAYAFARTLKPGHPLPGADDDLLILVERNGAPRKQALGRYGELLRYAEGPGDGVTLVAAKPTGGASIQRFGEEDLYWQATSRGGRKFDVILEDKAYYKGTAEHTALISQKVGEVAAVAGAGALAAGAANGSGNSDAGVALLGVALLAIAVGAIADGVSEAIATKADIRTWDSLPGAVLVASAPRGDAEAVEVRALDSDGFVLPRRSSVAPIRGDGRCAVAWTRTVWADKTPEGPRRAPPRLGPDPFAPTVADPLAQALRRVSCQIGTKRQSLSAADCLAQDGEIRYAYAGHYARASVPDRDVLCAGSDAPTPATVCLEADGSVLDWRLSEAEAAAVAHFEKKAAQKEKAAAAAPAAASAGMPQALDVSGLAEETRVLCRHGRGAGEMTLATCRTKTDWRVTRLVE